MALVAGMRLRLSVAQRLLEVQFVALSPLLPDGSLQHQEVSNCKLKCQHSL